MTPLELILCSLSEATAVELHRDRESQGFVNLKRDAKDAGQAAGEARQMVEKTLGRSVISAENFLPTKSAKQIEDKGKKRKKQHQSGSTLFDVLDEG